MKLRAIEGPVSGQIFPIPEGGLTIGRDPSSTISLADDEDISRNHGRIRSDGINFYIEDLKSTNGIRVNGANVHARQLLADGDRIGIGNHVFLFVTDNSVVDEDKLAALEARRAKQSGKPRTEPELKAVPHAAASPRGSMGAQEIVLWVAVAVAAIAILFWLLQGSAPPPEAPEEDLLSDGPLASQTTPTAPSTPSPTATTPKPRTRPAVPPKPATPPARPEPARGYVWIDSIPRGAAVKLNQENLGPTPVLATDVPAAEYEITLALAGYKEKKKLVRVPLRTPLDPIRLELPEKTCLLSSEPAGASVIYNDRIIGKTPVVLRDLPVGEHTMRLAESGYEPRDITVQLSAFRSTTRHAKLAPTTAALQIRTNPPGCMVFVNGTLWGKTLADPGGGLSQPMRREQLRPGTYAVKISDGTDTATKKLRLAPRGLEELELIIFRPTVAVKLFDGSTLRGMVREKNEHGDLTLAVSAERTVHVLASQIVNIQRLQNQQP